MGGKVRLTDTMIDKLQNYYCIAIRSNTGDLTTMKKAIYTPAYFIVLLLEGPDSWCGFMKDKATSTNNFKHENGLPEEVIKEVKPIYQTLSDDSLLQKCLDGKTQNQNESLNGMMWERVPKGVFVGSEVEQLGVDDAVSHFHIGFDSMQFHILQT